MTTQARLPGTLPTPAAARQKLKDATAAMANALNMFEGMREHLKAAKKEQAAAEMELAGVERVLVEAAEDSPEARDAERDQEKGWRRLRLAEDGVENLKATVASAKADLRDKRKVLAAAREDLEAIRLGRKRP